MFPAASMSQHKQTQLAALHASTDATFLTADGSGERARGQAVERSDAAATTAT
jgi:hypothetical protein